MASLIQIRRGTLAEWQAANPVLSNGEITFVTDQNKIKIGNGTSAWAALPYLEAAIDPDSIVLGQDTTGSYVEIIDGGNGISISGSGSESASVTITNTGVLSLLGTENEITVSASAGDITLSLPNSITVDVVGDLSGNADTASTLSTARTISLGGDLSGSASFDGGSDITITASIEDGSVLLGSDTTGDYVTQVLGSGEGILVSGSGESASVTIENTGVTSLLGTENEISVSASSGSVTLSLPDTINSNTTGSAATLTNAREIVLGGDLSGSASFDGSASIIINADIQPNSVVLGTDTTGNYIATASAGTGISITGSGSEDAAITITNDGVTSLAGTANQIAVSASNGDATLSFPSEVIFPGTVTLNANPQQALEAVTKQYVDAIAEGLHIHASVSTATTASVDLSSAPETIDGVTLTDGMRILVKNQSNTPDNGIYTYSASADALVRASDFNSSSEIQGGDFLFVTGGNTYADTGWVQTETITTLGTDPIIFTQFSGAGTYSAGTGLQLDGTVFSNTGVLSLAGTADEIEVSASSGNIVVSLPTTINANTTGSAASLTTSRTIELSGDVSGSASFNGSANASISSTLSNSGVTAGTYNNQGSQVRPFTVDAKGRITSIGTAVNIAIGQSQVTNLTSDLSNKAPLASPTFTGTVSASVISATGIVSGLAFRPGLTTTATSGSTVTLTASSTQTQIFTGSTAQNVNLPVTSTLSVGHYYDIHNSSSQSLTVRTSSSTSIMIVPANSSARFTCILASGTTSASWNSRIIGTSSYTGSSGSLVLSSGPTITNASLNGDSTAITRSPLDNSNLIATTAYADAAATTAAAAAASSLHPMFIIGGV